MMKTRLAAVKNSWKHLLMVRFLDVYRNDNHIAYYNFCQQYKDYFVIAKAKRSNCIPFIASFL